MYSKFACADDPEISVEYAGMERETLHSSSYIVFDEGRLVAFPIQSYSMMSGQGMQSSLDEV